ncbi:MAG: DUF1570 domain-containing protein [Planctomycetota bacterium]
MTIILHLLPWQGTEVIDHVALARQALEAGQPEDARSHLERGLWARPADPEVARLLAVAHEQLGNSDEAASSALLHYELLLANPEANRSELADAVKVIERLDEDASELIRAREQLADALVEVGKRYLRRKLPLTAADAFQQALHLLPEHAAALSEIDAIESKGGSAKAVAQLRRFQMRRRSPQWIARQDALHADFSHAYEKRTPNYHFKTNIGWEALEGSAAYMEQMNKFYRSFYHFREHGGTPVVNLLLFRTAAEFDEYNKKTGAVLDSSTAQAYYSPAGPTIVGWDPRDRGGSTLWPLYATLFHEAAHQFVDLVAKAEVPSWLNEGIATYFEGTRILDDGTVEINHPSYHRLSAFLASCRSEAAVSLRELLTRPFEDYRSENYCYGWALVYYFRNFENTEGEKIYLGALDKCLRSYRRGSRPSVAVFEEFFINGVERAEIDSIEGFEKRWRSWFLEREREFYDHRLRAEKLAERGRAHWAAGRTEKAVEALAAAVSELPDRLDVRHDHARLAAEAKDLDTAIAELRKLHREAGLGEKTRVEIEGGLATLDPESQRLTGAIDTFRDTLELKIDELVVERRGKLALWALAGLRRVFGPLPEFQGEIDRVEQLTRATLRRWRSLLGESAFESWWGSKEYAQQGGEIVARAGDMGGELRTAGLDLSGDFEYRVKLFLPEAASWAGLAFGMTDSGTGWAIAVSPIGEAVLKKLDPDEGDWVDIYHFPGQKKYGAVWSTLYLEVFGNQLRFYVDDRTALVRDFPPASLSGRVGFYASGDGIRFKDPEVRY